MVTSQPGSRDVLLSVLLSYTAAIYQVNFRVEKPYVASKFTFICFNILSLSLNLLFHKQLALNFLVLYMKDILGKKGMGGERKVKE